MCDETEDLREELLDYYGTAAFAGNMTAMAQLGEIEVADEDELWIIADDMWIDSNTHRNDSDNDVIGW